MKRGLLVALSGVDCAGKSTQRDLLMETLRASGCRPFTIYSRAGYTPGLRTIKGVLRALAGRNRSSRKAVSPAPNQFPRRASNLGHPLYRWLWLTVALLSLVWLYCVRIPLMRSLGWTVVCNRYLLDCLVDMRVNFPDERVEDRLLFRFLTRFAARPDVAFCLLVPPAETLARARQKSRFHWETLPVLEHRWREYTALAREMDAEVLDGTRPMEETAHSIQRGVSAMLAASRSGTAGHRRSLGQTGR